jgi:heme-degrading monooxygenase HmoA
VIIVVSRFRVANGLEATVRQAFIDRPHRVEHAPGFLGIEALTDDEDPAIFYLVTRWTDRESFERWYGSDEHDRSHALIPKGLKLDASYTVVRYLTPIPDDR